MEETGKQPENSKPEKGKQLKPYQFKPGQSGNPSGRPKGSKSVVACIRRMLNDGYKDRDIAEELAKAAIKHAIKGNYQYFKEIVDRTDGKLADKITGDGKLEVVVRHERDKPIEDDDDSDG